MPLSDDDGAPSSQDTLFLFRCLGQTRKQRQVDPELHFPHTIWFDGGEAVGEVRNDARNPQNMRLTAMKRESVSFRKARHLLKFSAGKEDNGEPAVRLCELMQLVTAVQAGSDADSRRRRVHDQTHHS